MDNGIKVSDQAQIIFARVGGKGSWQFSRVFEMKVVYPDICQYLIKSTLAMPVEERGIHNSLYRITENTCVAFTARISFFRSIGNLYCYWDCFLLREKERELTAFLKYTCTYLKLLHSLESSRMLIIPFQTFCCMWKHVSLAKICNVAQK